MAGFKLFPQSSNTSALRIVVSPEYKRKLSYKMKVTLQQSSQASTHAHTLPPAQNPTSILEMCKSIGLYMGSQNDY